MSTTKRLVPESGWCADSRAADGSNRAVQHHNDSKMETGTFWVFTVLDDARDRDIQSVPESNRLRPDPFIQPDRAKTSITRSFHPYAQSVPLPRSHHAPSQGKLRLKLTTMRQSTLIMDRHSINMNSSALDSFRNPQRSPQIPRKHRRTQPILRVIR